MPTMPPLIRPASQRSTARRRRDDDQRRGSSTSRGYGGRWRKARATHLKRHPFCLYCGAGAFGDPPEVTAADTVDHLYPQTEYDGVFWVTELWVSCCATCHSGPKQVVERRGRAALDALARSIGFPTLDEARPAMGDRGVKSLG